MQPPYTRLVDALGSLCGKGISPSLYAALMESGDVALVEEIDALPADQLRELEAAFAERARSADAFVKHGA